jgi:hypothetical protein
MDLIDLTQDKDLWTAAVNTAMNLQVPQNAGKFLSSCTTGGFSRRTQLHEVILVQAKINRKTKPKSTLLNSDFV